MTQNITTEPMIKKFVIEIRSNKTLGNTVASSYDGFSFLVFSLKTRIDCGRSLTWVVQVRGRKETSSPPQGQAD
jgi:hypothetical protein